MSLSAAEHLTTRALSLALDAASLRHRVIASNIAQAHVAGHVPQRVRFDALVNGHAASGAGPALQARFEPAPTVPGLGTGVSLDAEAAALAENTLHQQVLLRALQRHLGLLAVAVQEGRR